MRSFEYFTPTRVVFGKDTHLKVATLLKEQHCKKVLIHYGGHSAIKSGLIDEIRSVLDEAGIAYVTLGGVVPNPRLSKVREGIELCRRENVDFLLAVGGGSVIDSCKAIGYGLANPETEYYKFTYCVICSILCSFHKCYRCIMNEVKYDLNLHFDNLYMLLCAS